jgi:integrase/recombinase XerD
MEMKIRGFSKRTIETYLYHNQKFINYIKKSPRSVNNMDVKLYLEFLVDKGLKNTSLAMTYNSLKFYYYSILGRRFFVNIKRPKIEKTIPFVLSKEEIYKLISVTTNPKHKLLIKMLYSSGLRVSECLKLRFKDIDKGIVFVKSGKGNKDRLSILANLSDEINAGNPNNYIFQGRNGHLTIRSAQMILKKAAKRAKINKNVYPHCLRASFATHLIDQGEHLGDIKELLGHSNIRTTYGYIRPNPSRIANIKNPLNHKIFKL